MGRRKLVKTSTPRQREAYFRKITEKLAKLKNVETLKEFDFGHKDGQSYRASIIKIAGEPYCGFIKCFGGKYTRTRLFMPLSAWNSFVTDILSRFTEAPAVPSVTRQLGVIEEEEEPNRYFPCPYVHV